MKIALLLCVYLCAGAFAAKGAEILVFAAASLTDALKEIAAGYEKESGDKAIFNFGASSVLARQIQEGAPADVFFSADEEKMDGLEKEGLIAPGTRKRLLSNSLVIVVENGSWLKISSADDLTKAKRIALAETKTAPAGIYARKYLEQAGVWAKVVEAVVPTDNVRGALAAVESGNVEAAIVYKTDAAISRKVKVAFEVPADEAPRISYPIAVVKGAKAGEKAKHFAEYLSSAANAIAGFEKFGFKIIQR